ncbi:deoxyribonuclease-1-like isoform X2 [Glandiceps talaboti]
MNVFKLKVICELVVLRLTVQTSRESPSYIMAQQVHGLQIFGLVLAILLCQITVRGDDIEELNVAAFNVQVFGTTKMSKPDVVNTLIQIIQRYDIVVIQEIRDSSGTAIYALLNAVNSASSQQYSLAISPRLGRTSSKEQYGFLYRPDKVTVIDSYTYNDVSDFFEREPFIVRFSSPKTVVSDFVMVVIHTKPSDAVNEISGLVSVYDDIVNRWNIQDAVILGDFNAGCDYVDDSDWQNIALRTDVRFTWLIDDRTDTTVSNTFCAYDRIVVAGPNMMKGIWLNSASVFYFDEAYGLSDDQASDVSDHYPITFKLLPKLMTPSMFYHVQGILCIPPSQCVSRRGIGIRESLFST